MYGEGKQLLREHIRNKRATEELEEVPPDLFAKKSKHDLTTEEEEKLVERRKRNKEAAEKSRKKKKVEFEKLQSENDQLNQDKCELVSTIKNLKDDANDLLKENSQLRESLTNLKRWIGKRVNELGLKKYLQGKDGKTKATELDCADSPLMHGYDPSLHSSSGIAVADEKQSGYGFPAPSSKILTPSPDARYFHAPVVLATDISSDVPSQMEIPWLVDELAIKKYQVENNKKEMVANVLPPSVQHVKQVPEMQSVVVPEGQQVVYLPKDTILFVQGKDMPQVIREGPEMQHAADENFKRQQNSSEVVEIHTPKVTAMADPPADTHDEQPSSKKINSTFVNKEIAHDTNAFDPSTATAIESLLKLGYRVHVPDLEPKEAQSAEPDTL